MESRSRHVHLSAPILLCVLLLPTCTAGYQAIGKLSTGFKASQRSSNDQKKDISSPGGEQKKDSVAVPYFVIIILATGAVLVLAGLIIWACMCFRKRNRTMKPLDREGDGFPLGMPRRFSFNELDTATSKFSVKLGQGGFGSVYKGTLADGSDIAVKTLESNGQGEKEFRAEVDIIGGIHHHHLVRLIGYCAEGIHRMLAYEFMPKGSLDRWIFSTDPECFLDWEKRSNIFLGIAKGLAYLHEDCHGTIIHRDIKPENVLLDDQFKANVADFGLAKLITAEQSINSTVVMGTIGYIAPERFNNRSATTKSDVYSYGMMLLEIIAGTRIRMKPDLGKFASQMLEQGKLREILDSRLELDRSEIHQSVDTAVQVAVLCIQDEMKFRPSMTQVVQMLQALRPVPNPPVSTAPLGSPSRSWLSSMMRMAFSGILSGTASGRITDGKFLDGKMHLPYSPSGSKSDIEKGNTSGPSGCNDGYILPSDYSGA